MRKLCKMEKIWINYLVRSLGNTLIDNRWKENVPMERRLQTEFFKDYILNYLIFLPVTLVKRNCGDEIL